MSSRPSLDPLRYGLRALEEMAREQASVAVPARAEGDRFEPHPRARPVARDGAALSLRLFSEAEDDATAFVLGEEATRTLSPIPARAASFFEAHAAVPTQDGEDELVLGFPLATFTIQGSARVAPLFSRGGVRARWTLGGAAWRPTAVTRADAPPALPDALVLEAADDAGAYALHGGVWHLLFGFDGAALAAIADAGRAGLGALVRAATRALLAGPEGGTADASTDAEARADARAEARADADADADAEPEPGEARLSRDDLRAFCEAASAHGSARRSLRCHPHGLAMLPPRGDPTSGLRRELRELLHDPAPSHGPLAAYLGAPAAPLEERSLWSCSPAAAPTRSQLAAARALEGTSDLVGVRGPPGCGKTALLHHVVAQAVVTCALLGSWDKAPASAPWALVVTSTNNAAVDQALAPFVRPPPGALPLGLRLGSRRTLAELTIPTLEQAIAALETAGPGSLAEARAAFEACAAPVRAHLRVEAEAREAGKASVAKRAGLAARAAALREALARTPDVLVPAPRRLVTAVELEPAIKALREHVEAAGRLVTLHLEGKKASASRAVARWAKANAVRAPRIAPALEALGLSVPFGDLGVASAREDVARQASAMNETLQALARALDVVIAPGRRRELEALERALEAERAASKAPELPPDPALFEAALAVRDAWAHAHRGVLLVSLQKARAAIGEPSRAERGRPANQLLRALAPLFPVAGCTLLSMRASFPLERGVIDRLVIDEAAQCAPVYAAPALARARRAMLTGDTAQLPPVYTLDPRADARAARGLDAAAIAGFRMDAASTTSAQLVAEPRASARLALVEHFRSQREIVALASRWSGYSLDVRTPSRSLASVSPRLATPLSVLAVRGHGARVAEGVVNEAEARVVVALVEELLRDGVDPRDVAVLTPFVGQCARIERALFARGLPLEGGVLVSTVHRLQGGERRVVVFSVAATERRHLRWLAERPHLLHVATSRAQDHLIVLVDPDAAAREPGLAPLHEALR